MESEEDAESALSADFCVALRPWDDPLLDGESPLWWLICSSSSSSSVSPGFFFVLVDSFSFSRWRGEVAALSFSDFDGPLSLSLPFFRFFFFSEEWEAAPLPRCFGEDEGVSEIDFTASSPAKRCGEETPFRVGDRALNG